MVENNLEQQALSYLNSGQFKEAIGLYNKLWLDSDNDKWRQQLAYCYLQRAKSFATRGMVKEALGLWDNYSQYTQSPYDAYDHYISWLIQQQDKKKIQLCLEQLSVEQLDIQYPELAVLLGFLSMTDNPEFQQYLPQDSVFIAHLKLVQTAQQAYQDNNLEDMNKALKQLPYRSAFRDFRILLNAFIIKSSSTTQAQVLLAKIPAHSPYSHAARLLIASTREGSELVQGLLPFNHNEHGIIAKIKGLNEKQLEFIDRVTWHNGSLSDKVKFNLALQSLCDSEVVQQFCLAMLVTYPAGRREFIKHFTSINTFEDNRLKALRAECDQKNEDAEYYWKQCVTALIGEEPDNELKIALILRHIVGQQPESEEQVELLIESLEYDPNDPECYLQILRYYNQPYESVVDYKHWLDKTIKKFPQDISVLTQAIKAAVRNKTYQQANQYALQLLQVDPINTFAKQLLFSNYIVQTRRLLLEKKYHLVEQEIQQAEDLNLGKIYNKKIQLMRGFFCFFGQDQKQGLKIIVESLNKLNLDPVNVHFQATMEAQLTGVAVDTILTELPTTKDYLLSVQELEQFIQQLELYINQYDNHALIHKSLEAIKLALENALLQQDANENLLLTLCQTLKSIKHYELLAYCAKQGGSRWKKPIWDYYKLYSELNGLPERCPHLDVQYLESQREQAMLDKDHPAMVLIDSFLDCYYHAHPDRKMSFLNGLFSTVKDAEQAFFEDPLELLFGHIPEKIQIKLDNKLEALVKKTSPEMLVQQINKEDGDEDMIMVAMMQTPDLFTALLMVTAANESAIDINVSVADVLEGFGINQ